MAPHPPRRSGMDTDEEPEPATISSNEQAPQRQNEGKIENDKNWKTASVEEERIKLGSSFFSTANIFYGRVGAKSSLPATATRATTSFPPAQEIMEEIEHRGQEDRGLWKKLETTNDPAETLLGIKDHLRAVRKEAPIGYNRNDYLFDRLSHHLARRLDELARARAKHDQDVSEGLCESGLHCAERQSHGKTINHSVPSWIPAIPAAHLPTELECPLCFSVKRINKPSDWTNHLLEDIQPWICIWPLCKHPGGFKTMPDWLRHEENHRHSGWRCDVDDCTQIFPIGNNFEGHLVTDHNFLPVTEKGQYTADGPDDIHLTQRRIDGCRFGPHDVTYCLFCGIHLPIRQMFLRHMANHIERTAFSLLVIRGSDFDINVDENEPNRLFLEAISRLPNRLPSLKASRWFRINPRLSGIANENEPGTSAKPSQSEDELEARANPNTVYDESVDAAIDAGFRGEDYVFKLQTHFREFLTQIYEDGANLSNTLSLTGNLETAILCTVREYMSSTWPTAAYKLVDCLENIMDGKYDSWYVYVVNHMLRGYSTTQVWKRHKSSSKDANLTVKRNSKYVTLGESSKGDSEYARVEVHPDLESVSVSGSRECVASIAEQLCWLSAVCKDSIGSNRLSMARPHLVRARLRLLQVSDSCMEFFIVAEDVWTPRHSKSSCWNSLVGSLNIVTGFPCPPRHHHWQRGLEVSIPTMVSLSRIPQAVTFRGSYVFKGRYHALVPTEVHDDSIQWHFVDTYPERLTWSILNAAIPSVANVDLENLETVGRKRSFLGWCSEVVDHLGTSNYSFQSIENSQARKRKDGVRFDKVTMGFTQWAQVTGEFSMMKKHGYVRPNDYDNYMTLLDDARDMPVILHDSRLDRAVQTDAESLILHIIMHRTSQDLISPPSCHSAKDDPLVSPCPLRKALTTRQAMVENGEKVIRQDVSISCPGLKNITFKQEVQQLFSALEGLQGNDYASGHGNSPLLEIRKPHLSTTPLDGWEYMDIVTNRRKMEQKTVDLQKSCGKWVEYARDIESVVLFAANIPELLSASSSVASEPPKICRAFTSIPPGFSYLAVRIPTLRQLFEQQGSLQDQNAMTPSGYALQHYLGSPESSEIFEIHECSTGPNGKAPKRKTTNDQTTKCDETVVHRRVLRVVKRHKPLIINRNRKSASFNLAGQGGAVILGDWDGKIGSVDRPSVNILGKILGLIGAGMEEDSTAVVGSPGP